MNRKLLLLRYNGAAYHGWQVQNNGITVQQTVQDALEQLFGVRPNLTGCSRTDSGVHARMFCCHFDAPISIPNEGIICGLNRFLPNDISVYGCSDVADDFHARYSVKSKTYEYHIYTDKFRDPFYCDRSYYYGKKLSLDKCELFCKNIIGTHDFSAFCSSGSSVSNNVRTIYSASVREAGPITIFSVTADGFLYNMVRILVGTMLAVSEGRIDPESIPNIIASKERSNAGNTAPPDGLFLHNVEY